MEINAKKRLRASEVEPDPDYEELLAEINLNEAIHGGLAELIKEHVLPGINAARAKYERAMADTEKKLKATNESLTDRLESVSADVKALSALASQLQSSLTKFKL